MQFDLLAVPQNEKERNKEQVTWSALLKLNIGDIM